MIKYIVRLHHPDTAPCFQAWVLRSLRIARVLDLSQDFRLRIRQCIPLALFCATRARRTFPMRERVLQCVYVFQSLRVVIAVKV